MGLVKTHQKSTVKLTSIHSPSEKLNPAWCGFSNRKPTPTHTISTSTRGFCPWILFVGFARGFCSWIFCSWILFADFVREFLSVSFLFEQSMRAKYANKVCKQSNFWWDDYHKNIFLQCDVNLHYCITSSHAFFKFSVFLIFISLSSFFNKKIKFLKRTNFSQRHFDTHYFKIKISS